MTNDAGPNIVKHDRTECLIERSEAYIKYAASFSEIYYALPMRSEAKEKSIDGILATLDAFKRTIDAVISSVTLLDSLKHAEPQDARAELPLPVWRVNYPPKG